MPSTPSTPDSPGDAGLVGRRVLVLGGGGAGIGREVVSVLAARGARVAVADLDPARAAEAAADVGGIALSGDVRSAADLARLVTEAVEALGGLDVLVTVVGGQVAFVPSVRLHEMRDEDWDTMYELNLRYVSRAVRQVLGIFLDQGTGGVIVSVGSVAGVMGAPGQGGYGAMKAGLLSLARTVAAEYSADGVRMNVVVAGAVASAVANQESTGWVDEIPLGRPGTTAEVADAVAYLASPTSAYVTGQGLVIDGGVSTRGPFQR